MEQPSSSDSGTERVVRAETRQRFVPLPTGKANWRITLSHALRAPKVKLVPGVIAFLSLYVVGYNALVWYWKGPTHPLNRFMWRLETANGTLDPELYAKKTVVDNYYRSRFVSVFNDDVNRSFK